MPPVLTPEHFQLLSTRRLTDAADTTEEMTDMARMARYELRRRECAVPVRQRYDSVAGLTADRQKA